MEGEGNREKLETEAATEEKTSKINTQNRKRKSERIEEKWNCAPIGKSLLCPACTKEWKKNREK